MLPFVRMMQGRFNVTSEEGRGSTFYFTAQLGLGSERDVRRRESGAVRLNGTRTLVVDDNATNRQILHEILRSWGMRTDVAEDARQAMGLLHHAHNAGDPFKLVVTDAHMPDIDGISFTEQIRETPALKSTIIMMLTSGDIPSDPARYEQLKIESCLLKPVNQSELFDEMLPLVGVTATDDDHSVRPAAAIDGRRPLKVMLVEDSLLNQRLADAVLQKAGHHVTIANNGREAVETWRTATFDLILMDIQMPEMDGFDATKAIRDLERETGTHIPIIALTAHALRGDRERCLEVGMDAHVSKPIHAERLLETIESVLRNQLRDRILSGDPT
jgi:CheY-like chemotaxis protein